MSIENGFIDVAKRAAIVAGTDEDDYIDIGSTESGGVFAISDVAEVTKSNVAYRRAVYTAEHMQIVLMCITLNDIDTLISMATHKNATATVFIVHGAGQLISNAPRVGPSTEYLNNDHMAIVPAGVPHRILNRSTTTSLWLYVIYSEPVFAHDLVQMYCTDVPRQFDEQ